MQERALEKNRNYSWSEGYMVETEYTYGFYNSLAPNRISFAALLKGFAPVDVDKPFNYMELGCGNGFSTNVLAAANPLGKFYANDFNPKHIENANRLKNAAGISNVTFSRGSFESLQKAGLPRFDIIVLHGIYSWVSKENRGHIIKFIRDHLNDGGLVYISYNCSAGYSEFIPVRHIMLEVAEKIEGTIEKKIDQALNFVFELNKKDTAFFRNHKKIARRLEEYRSKTANYLAHELFNRDWTLFHYTEMVREMAEADLGFAAAASVAENFPSFFVPAHLLDFYKKIKDHALAQEAVDLAVERQFRMDIYHRRAERLTAEKSEKTFAKMRFVLSTIKKDCKMEAQIPVGSMRFKEEMYMPVINELEKGPKTTGELNKAINGDNAEYSGEREIMNMVSKLIAVNYVSPALAKSTEEERIKSAQRFNEAAPSGAIDDASKNILVSPVIGSAVNIGKVNQIIINGKRNGEKNLAEYVWGVISKGGGVMRAGNKGLTTPEENLKEIEKRIERFEDQLSIFYKNMGLF